MSQKCNLIIKNLEILTYNREKLNINVYQSYYVHSQINDAVPGGLALTCTVSAQQPRGVDLNALYMIPGEPYADITVNIPQSDYLPDNEAYVPLSQETNRNILGALTTHSSGCIERTEETVRYGINVPATRIIFHPERSQNDECPMEQA